MQAPVCVCARVDESTRVAESTRHDFQIWKRRSVISRDRRPTSDEFQIWKSRGVISRKRPFQVRTPVPYLQRRYGADTPVPYPQRRYGERLGMTYYDVLQRTTTHHDVLQRATTYYDVLRSTTTYYDVLRRTTAYYDVLRRTTTYYDVLPGKGVLPGPGGDFHDHRRALIMFLHGAIRTLGWLARR